MSSLQGGDDKVIPENIQLAKMVLEGASLSQAGKIFGKTRGRAWQVTQAFCLEYMFSHERSGEDGKIKGLKELRAAWQGWGL